MDSGLYSSAALAFISVLTTTCREPFHRERILLCHSLPHFNIFTDSFTITRLKMAELDECCKSGFAWDGTPVGHEGTLDKNKAYITGSNKQAAVLLIHDLFGWKFNNLRLLADHFAKEANCTCYVVDLYVRSPPLELTVTMTN
jgi:hypothetical protein